MQVAVIFWVTNSKGMDGSFVLLALPSQSQAYKSPFLFAGCAQSTLLYFKIFCPVLGRYLYDTYILFWGHVKTNVISCFY